MPAGYTGQGWKPLRERPCHAFLSHAHVDRKAIDRLNAWLQQVAGMQIWYDAERMQAGQMFPSALAEGVGDSQSMIVAVSKGAVDSQWVAMEQNHGLAQQGQFPRFAVIPVRLEPIDLPNALFAHSAVDAFDGCMDGENAARLLRSLHAVADLSPPDPVKRHAIDYISSLAGDRPSALTTSSMPIAYLTCGWRETGNEPLLRTSVCRAFKEEGFHLIGDAEDHQSTDEARIQRIMSSCSGQLVVVPRRADTIQSPEFRSLRKEVLIGRSLNVPQFFVVEKGVSLDGEFSAVPSMELDAGHLSPAGLDSIVREPADNLRGTWGPPQRPDYVFVATDYDDLVVKDHVVRHIAQITGLPCLKGSDLGKKTPALKIELAVRHAALVIANVVSQTTQDVPQVNLNACIEAGIALGAERQLNIVARRGASDRWKLDDHLPFMIRHNTVETYEDDQHLIGLVHRYARPFRRRIIAA
jgi:hypothetical protein